MSAPDPRYIVRRRNGAAIRAADVEHLQTGWLRVEAIRYRLETDEDARVCHQVADHIIEKWLPPSEVVEVVTLAAREAVAA